MASKKEQFTTFIKSVNFIQFGYKKYYNVIQFELDPKQVKLTKTEKEKLDGYFFRNKDGYYFRSFGYGAKGKAEMEKIYKALLQKYGEYFNAVADAEVISEEPKKKSKTSKAKTEKKSTTPKAKTEKKTEPKKETAKQKREKELKAQELKAMTANKSKTKAEIEAERDNIKGYDWETVIKSQGESAKRNNELIASLNAQVSALQRENARLKADLERLYDFMERIDNRLDTVLA